MTVFDLLAILGMTRNDMVSTLAKSLIIVAVKNRFCSSYRCIILQGSTLRQDERKADMIYDRISSPSFERFVRYFPLSSVDVVVHDGSSFILTKRAIQPYKGKWHLVGGIVHRNQRLESRAKQVVKEELNLDVKIEKFLGVYEELGLHRHYISHAFVARIVRGEIKLDFQSVEAKFFTAIPKNIIPFHRHIIRDAKLVSTSKQGR